MEYAHYQVQDFVMDDYFQRWVLAPDAETESFWQVWLRQNPHKEEIVREARCLIQLIEFEKDLPSPEEEAEVWNTIQRATATQGARTIPFTFSKNWYRIAAAVMALLLVGTVLFFPVMRKDRVTYTNDYGQLRTITLPDGSTVVLNANSTLSFGQNWQDTLAREVWLEGEAFFSVQRHKTREGYRKFIVHTEDLQVEVLGTEFNVTERKASTRVVLSSGKVKLDLKDRQNQPNIFMQPGELVEYSTEDNQVQKKRVNPQVYSAWVQHKWVLDHTSLAEVAERIEQTFGVEVSIASQQLAQMKVMGVVPTGDLDTLLKVLSATLDIEIVKQDHQVIIKP